MEFKIDKGTASKEFYDWLDGFNLNPLKLQNLEDEIERAISLLCFEMAEIRDGHFVLKLEKELADGTTELTFKNKRVSLGELQNYMKGKTELERGKNTISKMFTKAIVPSLFDSLDDDWANIQSIAAFFLPK